MFWIAILAAIALVAAGVFWRRSRLAPPKQGSTRATRQAERFAAVAIRTRSGACAPARALEKQRFLTNRSPTLPLPGCTNKRCDCTFAKLSDRRGGERRFSLGNLSAAAMFLKSERRNHASRRNAD
jgi:hypothetical protein